MVASISAIAKLCVSAELKSAATGPHRLEPLKKGALQWRMERARLQQKNKRLNFVGPQSSQLSPERPKWP